MHWWVNQNQTYKHETQGGFLWSPKANANGAYNQFYENMRRVQAGDVIFSFCDTRIRAIGIATGVAQTSPKPDFGAAGGNWSQEGWLVPVEFAEVDRPIRPKDHIDLISPHLPPKYSPLRSTGDGLQSVYLAEVPDDMANALIKLMGGQYEAAINDLTPDGDDTADDSAEVALQGRTDIGATTKAQLIKARRGQGIFKANVRLNEKRCRVTGVTDPIHLVASHIKPWSKSDDSEKLNGCNGLLLAPHIDHLFDKGLISFSDGGELLVCPKVPKDILDAWGIAESQNVGSFNVQQKLFLAYHRDSVFKG